MSAATFPVRSLVDSPSGLSGLDIVLAGERVRLLAARALHWPAAGVVFVADVHLGKAESFRAAGVPVPDGPTQATLGRLSELVDGCGVQHLVVLGDLFHARHALDPVVLAPVWAWRERHPQLRITLVRGNHDRGAGDPPPDLGIAPADEPAALGPFLLRHEPMSADEAVPANEARAADEARPPLRTGYALAGHLHPTVRIAGRGAQSARLRCFRIGAQAAVLPAFGDFTGGARLAWRDDDGCYAIAGDRVLRVPRPR